VLYGYHYKSYQIKSYHIISYHVISYQIIYVTLQIEGQLKVYQNSREDMIKIAYTCTIRECYVQGLVKNCDVNIK